MKKLIERSIIVVLIPILAISCGPVSQSENEDETRSISKSHSISDPTSSTANYSIIDDQLKNESEFFRLKIKFESGIDLETEDFFLIEKFFRFNNDEAFSEGMGYYLFKYFKGSEPRALPLLEFLAIEKSIDKEGFLKEICRLMCLEFQLEEYTKQRFLEDFPIFRNSKTALEAFEKCVKDMI